MMKRLINIITKNFWIKFFCLLAATALWLYVASGQNTVGKFPGSIKIKAINVPAGLVATYDEKTVDIKVMADPTVWRKLSAETFSAYIDLSAHSEGTYELPVTVVSSIPEVQIVEKNPEKIFVSLEPIISKAVNINKKIEGSAGEGLVAGFVELEPSKVEARGPKSYIDNLTEGTVVIKLNGETDDFSKTVSVVAYDENGEIVNNIDFIPAEVKASVPIVKASNNKTLGVKVKTKGNPKAGYFISNISVDPPTVDVTGSTEALSSIYYIETEVINVSDEFVDIEKDVVLEVGNGLALQSGSPRRVKVRIKFSQTESSKDISITPTAKNLDPTYKIVSFTPSLIQITCSGPLGAINKLSTDDVLLELDFSGKKLSTVNTVSFDINLKNFIAPTGISITSISPSVISAQIEKK